jgi:shikimate kinase
MEKNIIALAGPPCSGKTTAGKILSKSLCADFLDIDHLIQRERGHTIEWIFRIEGEAAFRVLEKRSIAAAVSAISRRTVISLGGGALLDNDTRESIQGKTILFTLWASPESLALRSSRQRPLASSPEQMLFLVKQREAHYLSLERIINTENKSPAEVAGEITQKLREEGNLLWFPPDRLS